MSTIVLRGEGKIIDKIDDLIYINLHVAKDFSCILDHAKNGLKELIIETSAFKQMQLDTLLKLVKLADLVTIRGACNRLAYCYATEAKKAVFQSPVDSYLVAENILGALNVQTTRKIDATIIINEGSNPEMVEYLLKYVFNNDHSISVQAHWSYIEVISNSGYGEKIEIMFD